MRKVVQKDYCRRCGNSFTPKHMVVHRENCAIMEEPEVVLTYRQHMEKKIKRFPIYAKYLNNPYDNVFGMLEAQRGISTWLNTHRDKPKEIKDGQ
jgi:hypothetical protein